jgi:ribosomal protein S18 acetylase RimI-like enzyme
VSPDDDLAILGEIASVAFASPGTAISAAGLDEVRQRAALADATAVALQRERINSGRTVMSVALLDGQPVGIGSHQPVGPVTEITGVGVLPAFRRRGIAMAVTAHLVDGALQRGVETVFLSAADEATARVYARIGFSTIATACIAEPRSAVEKS